MNQHNDIQSLYMAGIAAALSASGSHFFERKTLQFFGDRVSNWRAHKIAGRTFIRNVGHKPGDSRGFPHCTLRGQVREITFDENGTPDISQALKEFQGMRPLQILRAIQTSKE